MDFSFLLERCEESGKGHLRGILHHWRQAAQRVHVFEVPLLTALVVYGEARGEIPPGPQSVFQIIANRAMRITPHDLDAVLLKPYQFSCLNPGDVSFSRAEGEGSSTIGVWLKNVKTWVRDYDLGQRMPGLEKATIYARPDAVGKMYERWLKGDRKAWAFPHLLFCQTIGNHAFFEEV